MKCLDRGSHTFWLFDAAGYRLASITFYNYGSNYANNQAIEVVKAIEGATSLKRPELDELKCSPMCHRKL